MAVTKIHAIKSTLSKAIAYIENPAKTDGQLFVSGYNTQPQTASLDFEMTATMARKAHRSAGRRKGNLAYHLIQSFSPDDDLTPEQAHELGRKLASEFTGGRFEFVVATHLDKNQLHNHIIINAVSFYDYKKLRTVPYQTARQIRSISDRLCAESELSVLEEPHQIGQRYSDYIKKNKTIPMRTQVRRRLNFVLARATDYEQFKAMSAALGITVMDGGKHITYLYAGAKKPVRGNKLADTDKYLPEGIKEQLEINAANRDTLRQAIRSAVQAASSFSEYQGVLNQHGIRTRVDRRTGAITYIMNDADESRVPEDALGPGMNGTAIRTAIESGDMAALCDTPPNIDEILALYQSKQRSNANTPDTLVTVTSKQILQASQDGLLLAVQDRNGNAARFMLDADHVNGMPDGTIQIALGSAFEYDIVYSDGQHGAIRGGDLIRHIELSNGVRPTWVRLNASQIKSMSLKGVTISLPDAGIERLFIPADYVRYDKIAGTCHVAIYDNWDYSIVPVSDTGKAERRACKGASLADMLNRYGAPQQGDSLQRRIAYIERKATLANVRHLAATLNTMSRGNMRTAADFAPELRKIRKEIQDISAKISDTRQKNKQYALAARLLTTCRSYNSIWQNYLSTPRPLKAAYSSRHKAALDVYRMSIEQLERMSVHPDVDPDKVQHLIKDREKQIETDLQRLEALKKEEAELLAQQQTVQQLQKKNERNATYENFQI